MSGASSSAANELKMINGVHLLTTTMNMGLLEETNTFSLEELHISRIIENDTNSCVSFFLKQLSTTTSIQEGLNEKETRLHVKISRPKGFQSSLTTLNYVNLDTEKFYDEKVVKEVNLLYQRINYYADAVLGVEMILAGNVAVAWNDNAQKYCRVKILTDFISRKKKIRCKLLDDFGEVRVPPYSIFKLFSYYGKFPAKVQQIRLEHLRFYDDCVSLKTLLMQRLSINSKWKNRQDFHIELSGSVDEAGIPLGYLKDGLGDESINRSIINNLITIYHENKLFSEIGDNVKHLHVSHMLPTGHTYLQNKQAPMYRHLQFLLSLFTSRKDELTPVKKQDVSFDNFYVTKDADGQVSRVEIIPPYRLWDEYDYVNGVCVDFSDRGLRPPKPVPLTNIYLAVDVDPLLGYLPRQCYEVKLFKVPPIPPSLIMTARTLFPPDDLFSAVAADRENEDGLFSVELFNEKNSKWFSREIEQDGNWMPVYFRSSVNAEFLEIIGQVDSERRVPVSFTALKPSSCIYQSLTYEPFNADFSPTPKGKATTVFVDSVYSYDDMSVICKKDLGKRRKIEAFLEEYMKTAEQRKWTQATVSYVYNNPNAIFVAPWQKGGHPWCRAVVVRGRVPPDQLLVNSVNYIQVLLLDYALFRIVAIADMHILCIPKYRLMTPLGAIVQVKKRAWEQNGKRTFADFEALVGTTISIKIREATVDPHNKMWLIASILEKKSKSVLPPQPDTATHQSLSHASPDPEQNP